MDPTLIGLSSCIFSGVLFGSMFTPLRKLEMSDGFFVQWVQCAVIFVVGLIINFVRRQPGFEPLAAFGGLIFATGNITAIPTVTKFGAGLTILICGTVQILVGWTTARFGLLGLRQQIPSNPVLNYVGVALTLLSGLMFTLVNSEPTSDMTTPVELPFEKPGRSAEKDEVQSEDDRETTSSHVRIIK